MNNTRSTKMSRRIGPIWLRNNKHALVQIFFFIVTESNHNGYMSFIVLESVRMKRVTEKSKCNFTVPKYSLSLNGNRNVQERNGSCHDLSGLKSHFYSILGYYELQRASVRRNRCCFLSSEGEVHARCIARSSSLERRGRSDNCRDRCTSNALRRGNERAQLPGK